MDWKVLISVFKFSIFVVLLLLPLCSAANAPQVSKQTICKFTPDPSYCNFVLPNQTSNVQDFWHYATQKSLSQSRQFLTLVNKYLQRHSATLSNTALLALQDCQSLAGLNIDFLTTSLEALSNRNYQTLSASKTDGIHTMLSAILTNQQTCLDGIQATASSWSVETGLSAPISNYTSLYSVSLSLFTKAWLPKNNIKGAKLFDHQFKLKIMNDVLVKEMVIVSKDGSGDFKTIKEAVKSAPKNTAASDGYFLIYIRAGVYKEYVTIDKKNKYIMMVGEGINRTIVTGNRNVADGQTTFKSATFIVVGQGFVGVNMTFRNTAGAIKHQAVAVRNGADESTFYRCSFEGYQDTLYTHSMRQFYRECDIYGTVDFIFGNAAVVLQKCNIYPRLPLSKQFNAITAQGRTDPNQNTGISIQKCTIRASAELASSDGSTKTYLGRPWKEYSRTIYMQSFMDGLIEEEGWHEWSGDFALKTLYYAEFENNGPGSDTRGRVRWAGYHKTNACDAARFTVSNLLAGDNWLPKTGVPYSAGLN